MFKMLLILASAMACFSTFAQDAKQYDYVKTFSERVDRMIIAVGECTDTSEYDQLNGRYVPVTQVTRKVCNKIRTYSMGYTTVAWWPDSSEEIAGSQSYSFRSDIATESFKPDFFEMNGGLAGARGYENDLDAILDMAKRLQVDMEMPKKLRKVCEAYRERALLEIQDNGGQCSEF